MAEPSVPALDDFNRANENPLSYGGKWIGLSGFDRPQLLSNTVRGVGAAGNICLVFWNDAQYGGNVESAVKVPTVGNPGTGEYLVGVYAKMDPVNYLGYEADVWYNGSGWTWQIVRWDAGFEEHDLVSGSVSPANGDLFFLWAMADGTLIFYRNGSELGRTTDAVYKDAVGNVGFFLTMSSTPTILDDFQGGVTVLGGQPTRVRTFGIPTAGPFRPQRGGWN
jgi:hypothetical protein